MNEANERALAAWHARWLAQDEYPDPWPPIARAWFDRFLRIERLRARQFLAYLKVNTPAVTEARKRWKQANLWIR